MDTASHFLIGAGLGGLAHLSPTVAANPSLGVAVTIGAILASEAPDFDYIYRLRGEAAYLRNHRGVTHSIPALLIWPSVITLGLMPFFHEIPWGIVWLWNLIAVLLHVGLDVLNTYGTQAFRPFSEKWVSKDILMILDPFIFLSQLAGIVFWWTHLLPPGPLFAWIDGGTLLYVAWRAVLHQRLVKQVSRQYEAYRPEQVSVIPTFRFNRWQVVVQTSDRFILGKIKNGLYAEEMALPRKDTRDDDDIKQKSETAEAFLYFAKHVYQEIEEAGDRIRFKWTDLRFRFGSSFPFRAMAEVSKDGRLLREELGWGAEEGSRIKLREVLRD